jgi:O-antigen/teichoic acid export membrane protein
MTGGQAPGPAVTEDRDNGSLSRDDLKEATLDGVRWVTLGRVAAEAIALAGSVVLARLVSPSEFGHAVLAIFLFALAGGMPAGSFGSPLVHAETLRPAAVRTALTLSLVSGVLVTALIVVVAPLLTGLFGARTVTLLQLAAPLFTLYSACAVSQALIQRQLDFRRMAVVDILAVVPSLAASIVAAALGWGGAAIVVGFLVTGLSTLVLSLYWAPPGRPGYDGSEARQILRFGIPLSMSSLLWNASRNVQLAILGARMPAAQVGAFWRASMLGVYYQAKVSAILLRMMFPVLSRARSSDEIHAFRARMVQVHTTLLFPFLGLLVVIAPVLIPLFYGPEWQAAVVPTQILAAAGAATVVGTGTGPLMMAIGRADALMRYDLVYLVVFAAAVLLAAGSGITVVAIVVSVHALVFLVIQQYFLAQRLAGVPLVDTVTESLPALVGCLGLVGIALPVELGLRAVNVPDVVVLVVTTAAGGLAYALAVRTLFPTNWRDLALVAGRVFPAHRLATVARARRVSR